MRRLRWQCRRGMLELDWLLEAYLERAYPTAPPAERADFEALLGLQDPLLQAWLLSGTAEVPGPFREIVVRVRAAAMD